MRGYDQDDQDLDEYEDELEDQDGDVGAHQYEDEEDEDDEEEEEEEEASIPEEKLRYLDLRQKLKEEARSKIRKENGESGNKLQDRKGVAAPLGKFGSFFGPSRPVVADRVIQESKSLLETRHLAAKQSIAQNSEKKVPVSSSTSFPNSKNGGSNRPLSSQFKTKAQSIKQTRDFYSSLWADDAEPKPGGDAGSIKNTIPKTDARSAQVLSSKSSEPSSTSTRKGLHGYEQKKKPSSGNLHSHAGQPPRPQKSISGHRPNLVSPESKTQQLDPRKVANSSKQQGSSNGSGTARSAAVARVLPPKKPLPSSDRKVPSSSIERKASISVGVKTCTAGKNTVSNGQRFPPVKSQTSIVRKPVVDRRDIQHGNRDGKLLTKESMPVSKSQTMRPPPKQEPVRSNVARDRYIKEQKPSGKFSVQKSSASRDPPSKKRRADDAFSDEELDYRSAIRAMFGRPRHYNDVDEDDDDMCMESGFDDILREERRSAKIAKKEDDEELEKIMEEERQEKLRREAKLRRKQHQQ